MLLYFKQAASHTANLLLEEARLGAELTVLQRQNRTKGCSKHEQNLSVFQTLGVTTRDGELRSLTYQQVRRDLPRTLRITKRTT